MGQAFTWIGVDELGHFSTPFVWNYLRSRLRRIDQSIIPYMRATANPGGLGGWWIKKMFVAVECDLPRLKYLPINCF
jgi:hypothetical protein